MTSPARQRCRDGSGGGGPGVGFEPGDVIGERGVGDAAASADLDAEDGAVLHQLEDPAARDPELRRGLFCCQEQGGGHRDLFMAWPNRHRMGMTSVIA